MAAALATAAFFVIVEPASTQLLTGSDEEPCEMTTAVFERSELMGYPGRNISSTTEVDLTCGLDADAEQWFSVVLVSSDEGHRAGYQPEQTGESWKLQGFDDTGALLYESPYSADLSEATTNQARLVDTAELSGVTYLQAVHGGDTTSANSVHAMALLVPTDDPNPEPPPTTTTTTRPTTTSTQQATTQLPTTTQLTTTTTAPPNTTTTTQLPPPPPPPVDRCVQPSAAIAGELDGSAVKSQVWRLYHTLLGRPPVADGLDHWSSLRQNGDTHFTVGQRLYQSDEAIRIGLSQMTNTEFVLHMFANMGCRPPAVDGLLYWTSLLDNGVDRWNIAVWFAESPEVLRLTETDYPLFG